MARRILYHRTTWEAVCFIPNPQNLPVSPQTRATLGPTFQMGQQRLREVERLAPGLTGGFSASSAGSEARALGVPPLHSPPRPIFSWEPGRSCLGAAGVTALLPSAPCKALVWPPSLPVSTTPLLSFSPRGSFPLVSTALLVPGG